MLSLSKIQEQCRYNLCLQSWNISKNEKKEERVVVNPRDDSFKKCSDKRKTTHHVNRKG
jgi:hypothetical protein